MAYLAPEFGVHALTSGGRSYDQALRIPDALRWAAQHAQPSLAVQSSKLRDSASIETKRWLYLNFIIWRKLRVVDKTLRRGLDFTRYWYQLQVLDHLYEAYSRLAGTFIPPGHILALGDLDALPARLRLALTVPEECSHLLDDPPAFQRWAWDQFTKLQARLIGEWRLSADAVSDPLHTQWVVQYWKYEDLFA